GDGGGVVGLGGRAALELGRLRGGLVRAYERRFPANRTVAGRPRQRAVGGGRTGVLDQPGQKLLFLLVYLKTYPLQVVMAELFGLSQPRVNQWLRRLLPVLRDALDDLGVRPERDASA